MAIVRFEELLNSGKVLGGVDKKIKMDDGSKIAIIPENDLVKLTVHCAWSYKIVGIELTRDHAAELKDLFAEALEKTKDDS